MLAKKGRPKDIEIDSSNRKEVGISKIRKKFGGKCMRTSQQLVAKEIKRL